MNLHSPIGLIAGNGSFPCEFAEAATARGLKVIAVAHEGETDPALEGMVAQCTWIRVGQLGKLLSTLRRAGVREAAFAGGIKKVRLFGGVKLDWKGVRFLSRLKSTKDDVILRGLAAEVEREGISVISAGALLTKSVPRGGVLTKRSFTSDERQNAAIGWEAAAAIGALDIGQTVIVSKGVVVAVEAVEGTDAAIRRAGELAGPGCVIVKRAKPQQDLRIDLPAIGIETMNSMRHIGATALLIESEKALILDPLSVVAAANQVGIAIMACGNAEQIESFR